MPAHPRSNATAKAKANQEPQMRAKQLEPISKTGHSIPAPHRRAPPSAAHRTIGPNRPSKSPHPRKVSAPPLARQPRAGSYLPGPARPKPNQSRPGRKQAQDCPNFSHNKGRVVGKHDPPDPTRISHCSRTHRSPTCSRRNNGNLYLATN